MKKSYSEKVLNSFALSIEDVDSHLKRLTPTITLKQSELFITNFLDLNLKNLHSDKFPFLRSKNKKLEKIIVSSELVTLKDLLSASLIESNLLAKDNQSPENSQTLDSLAELVYLALKKYNNI